MRTSRAEKRWECFRCGGQDGRERARQTAHGGDADGGAKGSGGTAAEGDRRAGRRGVPHPAAQRDHGGRRWRIVLSKSALNPGAARRAETGDILGSTKQQPYPAGPRQRGTGERGEEGFPIQQRNATTAGGREAIFQAAQNNSHTQRGGREQADRVWARQTAHGGAFYVVGGGADRAKAEGGKPGVSGRGRTRQTWVCAIWREGACGGPLWNLGEKCRGGMLRGGCARARYSRSSRVGGLHRLQALPISMAS